MPLSWGNDDSLSPSFKEKKTKNPRDSFTKRGSVETIRGTPIRALTKQGFFWPNVTVIRLFGVLALQSKN